MKWTLVACHTAATAQLFQRETSRRDYANAFSLPTFSWYRTVGNYFLATFNIQPLRRTLFTKKVVETRGHQGRSLKMLISDHRYYTTALHSECIRETDATAKLFPPMRSLDVRETRGLCGSTNVSFMAQGQSGQAKWITACSVSFRVSLATRIPLISASICLQAALNLHRLSEGFNR